MEYIYGNADKYKTRIMEEYARAFYREMQFIDPISKSIKGFFRILRCCDDKVICYRHIDESLKEDLENMNNGCSKMTLGKNWFISAIKHDKFENSYTFALYNGSAEIMTMKEYICYQVNYFFESLLGLAEKKNGDVEISIRNMIYENAIAFVDRKINNTINMAMGPRVMLAENISKISYLHYEGNKVNKKYIVWGIKKEDCDIIFSNDIMFNDETKLNHDKQIRKLLEITYKDKNIFDVLDMRVDEALSFFSNIPSIAKKLQTLHNVGLGYIKLGQSSTTLSGGEAQRIKLAYELQRSATGNTLYIMDEPTTGLHIDDIKKLMNVIQQIVNAGNTVVVIEHNLDLIKCADYIVDLGPEGGENGGQVVATGTPEEVAENPNSYTGQYLKKMLARN